MTFELTPKLRSVAQYDGSMFYLEGDDLIAARTIGGRAEFARIDGAGRVESVFAPVAEPELN